MIKSRLIKKGGDERCFLYDTNWNHIKTFKIEDGYKNNFNIHKKFFDIISIY